MVSKCCRYFCFKLYLHWEFSAGSDNSIDDCSKLPALQREGIDIRVIQLQIEETKKMKANCIFNAEKKMCRGGYSPSIQLTV